MRVVAYDTTLETFLCSKFLEKLLDLFNGRTSNLMKDANGVGACQMSEHPVNKKPSWKCIGKEGDASVGTKNASMGG